MPLTTQPGIILRKSPYSEADEIVTVLLREGGVQRFFAAGSRKSKKSFAGLVDHFAHLNLKFTPRHEGLWRLLGAEEGAGAVPSPWQEPRNFALASYLAEVVCAFTPAAVHSEDLFRLWLEVAEQLARAPATPAFVVRTLARFLALFGYAIAWWRCAGCGGVAVAPYAFDAVRGGPICLGCLDPVAQNDLYPPALIDYVASQIVVANQDLPPRHAENLVYQLARFTALILQKPVRSEDFLMQTLVTTR